MIKMLTLIVKRKMLQGQSRVAVESNALTSEAKEQEQRGKTTCFEFSIGSASSPAAKNLKHFICVFFFSIVYSNDLPLSNQPYYMVVHAKPVPNGRMQYSSFFYVPGDADWNSRADTHDPYTATHSGWQFLSTIEVGAAQGGTEWWMSSLYSAYFMQHIDIPVL